ncbi:MAG TPA: hypothetical protein DCY17_00915 [Clostridiales bacterium]|nr:hypothetical protein [Clostridiales bacterium]
MPNISQNVNNFLRFSAEKPKTYAIHDSFVRIFTEKRLNGVGHSSDVSAVCETIPPSVLLRSSSATAQYRENHRTGFGLIAAF